MVKSVNYHKYGRTLGDAIFYTGLDCKLFVSLLMDNQPYVVLGPLRYKQGGLLQIEFVHFATARNEPRRAAVDISKHFDDPEYDGSKITRSTPRHFVVDKKLLGKIKLRGVGD